MLIDRFGRRHTYLRISVTDRCNLRCAYCMPFKGIVWKNKKEILTLEEICRVASIFVELGITKIRLTGGEPLVRRNVEALVRWLAELPGVEKLAMTTNGVLLREKAHALKAAGLKALNVSLDTLRRSRFEEIAKRDHWDDVMAGIEAALACEFDTLKVNCVVIKGFNDDEILDFVEFARDKPMNVRFIEYMPFPDNQWHKDGMLSFARMKEHIEQRYELVPLDTESGAVAKDFAIGGRRGTVSFITSMSESFCESCNRLRLTADGSVKSCLFYAPEINLRGELRSGLDDAGLREMILSAVLQKPEAHPPMEELVGMANRAMVEIGG